MHLQRFCSVVFLLVVVTNIAGRPAKSIDTTFLKILISSFLESVEEAGLTQPPDASNATALSEWRLANSASLARKLELHLRAIDYFTDPENDEQLQDLEDYDVSGVVSDEERKKWTLITTVFARATKEFMDDMFEDAVEIGGEGEPAARRRRARAAFAPLTDFVSSEAPRISLELINQLDLFIQATEHSSNSSASSRQRRSLTDSLSFALTQLGGLSGLVTLLGNTTLYNFVMPYIYAIYAIYFAHSQERVDEKRKLSLSILVCLDAIASGRGSLPGNAGCRDILMGEQIQSAVMEMEEKFENLNFTLAEPVVPSTVNRSSSEDRMNSIEMEQNLENVNTPVAQQVVPSTMNKISLENRRNFQRRLHNTALAPKSDELPFDAKALVDDLQKWSDDSSLSLESMDRQAIRALHADFQYSSTFSPETKLEYKKKLLRYCHVVAAANLRRRVWSTCPPHRVYLSST